MFSARITLLALALHGGAAALEVEHLSSVAQDSRDYVYFPSHEGLLRYDGEHLLNLSVFSALPSGLARDIEISDTDIAYVLYNSGLVWSIDLRSLEARLFAETSATNIAITHESLFTQEPNRVLEYKLSTGEYAIRLSGKSEVIDLESGYGNVYALANDGLYQFQKGMSTNVVSQTVEVGDIDVTPHGAVYFANDHLGYYSSLQGTVLTNYSIKNAENLTYVAPYFVYYTDGDSVNEASLTTLEQTRTQVNSTRKTYLSLFADSKQQLWGLNINEFGIVEGSSRATTLAIGSPYNILERVNNSWWVGTTKGVYNEGKPVDWLNDQIGTDFEVTAFSTFAGYLIVSTNDGAYSVDVTKRVVEPIFDGYVINSTVIDEQLYLATDESGIARFNSKLEYDDFHIINSMLISNEILNVTEIDNYLYISTAAGLVRANEPNSVFHEYQGQSKVTDVAKLNSDIYMATYGDGLYRKDGDGWLKVPSPKYIKEIVEAQNKIYLLTNNGIHFLEADKFATQLIRETQDHAFMIGSVRLVGERIYAVSDSAFLELTDFREFELDAPIVSYVKSPNGITLGGDSLTLDEDGWLDIAVSNLQYAYNERVKYEYRFNGGEWFSLHSPILQLNELAPNRYVVEFRQRLGEAWSEPVMYQFKITSAWYNSPTAITAYITLVMAVLIAAGLYVHFWIQSFHRVYRQNREKLQRSNLTHAAMLAEQARVLCSGDDTMLTEGLVKLDKVLELLEPIAHNGPYLGDQKLKSGLDLLQVQSNLQAKIKVHFDVTLGRLKLDKELENNVYSVVYHALHNAILHSEGTFVKVNIHKLKSQLEVCIEDDGIGIPLRSRLHFGEGLYTMRDIAKALNIKLRIKTGKKGTSISMMFPLIEPESPTKEEIQRDMLAKM
ncbi:ATP-binding protein [Pseudoalteromonas rubra]|uniref:sensor histidine kinase n=1 Tax=Pseudoalteromonas rubra TaxID=43658 RepID=UPI002DB8BB8F|nr:ATP-binding protein [Pseudoalteromonas rubra]MEC4091823.1 ATP-binding protein [Pseudoalteromonas rubra]